MCSSFSDDLNQLIYAEVGSWESLLGSVGMVRCVETVIFDCLDKGLVARRFPMLTGEVFRGGLAPRHAQDALVELNDVVCELTLIPVGSVALQFDVDISSNGDASHLGEFFRSPDGRNFFDVLRESILKCYLTQEPLILDGLAPHSRRKGGLFFAATGLVWSVSAFLFFPREVVALFSGPWPQHGILLWALGAVWAGYGFIEIARATFPLLDIFCDRNFLLCSALRVIVLLAIGVGAWQ